MGRAMKLDGALAEDGRLGRAPGLLVVVLQRKQQGQIRVATKRRRVGAFGNGAELRGEGIVGTIQLFARGDDFRFVVPV